MISLRTLTVIGSSVAALSACADLQTGGAAAQGPVGPRATAGPSRGTADAGRLAMMETHMKAMREMHEKIARARTPEERQALMPEHMKLMEEGMALLRGTGGGMGMGMGMGGMGMGGMSGMGGPQGGPADDAAHQQMMEMRMEMMQSMMEMMIDRMKAQAPAAR